LGHVHIFRSMSISLCETSHVVTSDVSHDVPKVFFFYNDVMLNVPERTHIGITTFQYPARQRNDKKGVYSYQSGLPF
jgi:hypothetical protein